LLVSYLYPPPNRSSSQQRCRILNGAFTLLWYSLWIELGLPYVRGSSSSADVAAEATF
jgi:hypothetical protein